MESNFEVLLVEDNPGDVRLIREYLNGRLDTSFHLDSISQLENVRNRLSEQSFDAMVLDLNLSDSRAQNTINSVKDLSKRVPIVVLTGTEDQELIQEALQAGAQDYLVKGELTGNLLSRSLRYAIERHRTQKQLKQSQQHYRSLFEDAPVAKFVEDFSEVKRYIDGLRDEGVSDFRSYFEDHPEDVKHCARLIRTIEANDACQRLYRAPDKSAVMNCVDELYMDVSWPDFREELLRYVQGHEFYKGETVQRTFDDARIHVYLKSRLAPGAEEDWSRVYVSMVDITERVKAEQHLTQRTRQLNERLKELKCLQAISRILENRPDSTHEMVQKLAEAIPAGYQFPDQTSARVRLDDVSATSPGFSPAGSVQRRDITHNGDRVGKIEVFRDPGDQESAFIAEEEDLLDEIASRLEAVHERNRAQVNLRESEQRFRQMAENIDQVFWLMTYDEFEIIYVSPAFEEVFGRPVERLYEDPDLWMDSVHEEEREELHRRFPEDFDDVEYRIVRPDGEVRWLHEQAVPVRDDRGEIYRIAGVAEDVTERKRAQVELAESERRFQQLITNIDEVYWMFNRDFSELMYVSPGFEEMFGFSPERLEREPLSFLEAVHPEDRQRLQEEIKGHVRDLQDPNHHFDSSEYEYRVRVDRELEGTRVRWLLTRAFPITDDGGKLIRMAGVTKDITERKRAEMRLAESEQRFRQMAENIDEIFWMFDADFNELIYMSPQYEDISGQSLHRLYEEGRAFFEVIHPEDEPRIQRAMERLVEGEEVDETEYRIVHKETGKVRWILTSAFPVKDDQGEFYRITGYSRDITERKQAEFDLAESEQRFRQMAENIDEVFWMFDADFNELIYMSPQYEELSGQSIEELEEEAQSFFEIIHPDDHALIENAIEKLTAGEEVLDLEHRYVHKQTGKVRWMHSEGFPVKNEQGEIYRITGFTKNITERKLAKMRLAESEERFRLMAENIEDVFYMHPEDFSEILYMNSAFESIWGIDRQEVYEHPMKWRELIHPEDRNEVETRLERSIERDFTEPFTFTYRIVRPDDSVRWIQATNYPILNEQGERTRIVGLAQDITQRKRAEMELAESEERFRQMAENTDEVIWLTTPDLSELEYINSAFENIFGIPREAVFEDPYAFWSHVPEDEQPKVEASLRQFSRLEQGEQSEFEWRIEHPEKGTRWLWTRGFPVCNDEGDVIHITGFTRDITELNRTMENLERTIEEKETLLKEVHHRVRNNLQVISSLLGLQRRKSSDPAVSDLLLNSKSRVHAMALIHKRLYESGTFTDINFEQYVEDLTRDIVDFNQREGLELSTRVDVEETDLDFDTIVPCGLIINELVTNSIKHAFKRKSEGTVSITLSRNRERSYELEVSDDGRGWQAEHSFRESSSLGLNLVVNLVENQLHGEIEHEQDDGTTFRITFPPLEKRFDHAAE